jgi:Na+/proline symporter
MILPAVMLTVGVGLYAYFQHFPMTAEQLALVEERSDYIFPIFILQALPVGVRGLLFASIFSAATQTAAISAMAQTALTFYRDLSRRVMDDRQLVRASRAFVVLAGVVICGMAILCTEMQQYKDLLRLAMAMAGYTYGAMLGILFLALLPLRRDGRGLIWGVPFSMLLVFALNWQQHAWAQAVIAAAVAGLVMAAVPLLKGEWWKVVWVLAGAAIVLVVTFVRIPVDGAMEPIKLAFPWAFPLGAALTLGLGILLGREPVDAGEPAEPAAVPATGR